MSPNNQVVADIRGKIEREHKLIQGFQALKKKTQNPEVIQKCNNQIRDTQANIDFLQQTLDKLQLQQQQQDQPQQKLNYTRFDLIKYDCPSLGHKIQHMVQQLQFKLQVENQYREANQKISHLYLLDGDKLLLLAAEGGKLELDQRIQLLNKLLRFYQNMHIDVEDITKDFEIATTPKHARRPLLGKLTVAITCVRDIDHVALPMFNRKPETIVVVKLDDVEQARTRGLRTDKFNEELVIDVDRGNEIEISVFDKVGSNNVPVAVNWALLLDITEEIRKKKVAAEWQLLDGENQQTPQPNVSVQAWLALEPAGQILVTLLFEKRSTGRQFGGGIGRHGAIREKKEEVFEHHGHQFVQKQFYNIMCCAFCGEFLRYTGYQCQDCKFLCHKKCYTKVVTKCILKLLTDVDDETMLNHRIPHRFEPVANRGTKWCCHCGHILPWGKKNVRKCTECGVMCHTYCTHLVPNLCGMLMEMANKILATINQTKPRKVTKPVAKPKARLPPPKTPDSLVFPEGPGHRHQHSFDALGPDGREQMPGHRPQHSFDNSPSKPLIAVSDHLAKNKQSPQSQLNQPPVQSPYRGLVQLPQRKYPELLPTETNNEYQQAVERDDYRYDNYKPRAAEANDPYKLPEVKSNNPFSDDFANFDYQNPQLELLAEEQAYVERQQEYIQMQKKELTPATPAKSEDVDMKPAQPAPSYPAADESVASGNANETRTTTGSKKKKRRKVGLDDFQFLAVLGKGNFGKVMLAELRHTSNLCAIKVLKKDFIVENDEAELVKLEKRVFLTANKEKHPFLLNLHCCFQTENRIYFVMEFISGGDLMWHIQKLRFLAKRAKFYACEVLLGLKYFHDNGIVYRDLKLDNILLTTQGHIKIGDYGLCKENMWHKLTTGTFCGTPEFMAPEIIAGKPYDRLVDWWAFGVLLFQMLLCQSPFKGDDEDEIFNAIEHDVVRYPILMPRQTVLVLQALLTKDPRQRLGALERDALEIMEHPYFSDVNFDDVLHCRIPAPYIPEVLSEHDYLNFDQEFTSETPRLTPVETVLTLDMQEQFRGFSHIADNATI
ncbi:protein kinase [Kocuria palustris]|nr:protein kinase [Kocuria palustris]